jgi:uncharacterized protein
MTSSQLKSKPSKFVLWLEFAFLSIGMPLLFLTVIPTRALFVVLWCSAFYTLWVLKRYHGLSLLVIWNHAALTRANIFPILKQSVLACTAIGLLVWYFLPEKFLLFPQERPALWAMVMLLYPLLSVIPQELIFRPFFFNRYRALFATPMLMLCTSAITFGFAHIIFQNWVSVTLCIAGGYLFARTYARTKSLALVWMEHAIYGCFVFTIGLGTYFYHGSVQVIQAASGS